MARLKQIEEYDDEDGSAAVSSDASATEAMPNGRLRASSSHAKSTPASDASQFSGRAKKRRLRTEARSNAANPVAEPASSNSTTKKGSSYSTKALRKTTLRFAEEAVSATHKLASQSQADDDRDASEQALQEARAGLAKTRLRSFSRSGAKGAAAKGSAAAQTTATKTASSAGNASGGKAANQASKSASRRAKKDLMRIYATKGKSAQAATAAKSLAQPGSPVADVARKAQFTAARLVAAIKNGAGAKTALIALGIVALIVLSIGSVAMPLTSSIMQNSVATSYASTDQDIKDVDAAYSALESQVEAQTVDAQASQPGYDEYRYQIAEIGHDPYALAALLTAKYGEYNLPSVRTYLEQITATQYPLSYTASTETREREVADANGGTTVEQYQVTIMTVTLSNIGISGAAEILLTPEQLVHFQILCATKGNRDDLFQGSWNGSPSGGGFGYDIPAEALKDAQFAAMIGEAEKYLGYPYVWGGSSPSTSFDCSGFVCWVINHSVGDVGRTTAEGLRGHCSYVSPADAKPGDLIFFENTYPEVGASHVGIYVGGGMMIHCGGPIQYASIESSYWQQHFMAFGRLH